MWACLITAAPSRWTGANVGKYRQHSNLELAIHKSTVCLLRPPPPLVGRRASLAPCGFVVGTDAELLAWRAGVVAMVPVPPILAGMSLFPDNLPPKPTPPVEEHRAR